MCYKIACFCQPFVLATPIGMVFDFGNIGINLGIGMCLGFGIGASIKKIIVSLY